MNMNDNERSLLAENDTLREEMKRRLAASAERVRMDGETIERYLEALKSISCLTRIERGTSTDSIASTVNDGNLQAALRIARTALSNRGTDSGERDAGVPPALSKETQNTRSTVFKHPDGWMPGDPE